MCVTLRGRAERGQKEFNLESEIFFYFNFSLSLRPFPLHIDAQKPSVSHMSPQHNIRFEFGNWELVGESNCCTHSHPAMKRDRPRKKKPDLLPTKKRCPMGLDLFFGRDGNCIIRQSQTDKKRTEKEEEDNDEKTHRLLLLLCKPPMNQTTPQFPNLLFEFFDISSSPLV